MGEYDVYAVFYKAPFLPAAGPPLVSAFDGSAQADLYFLGKLITFHSMDLFSRDAMFVSVYSNPSEARDAFAVPRPTVSRKWRRLQPGNGGNWRNGVWADLRSERIVRLEFHGKRAHPWMLEPRDGLACGAFNRPRGDGRFSDRTTSNEVQFCLNATLNQGGVAAHRMAVGSNPVDLFA